MIKMDCLVFSSDQQKIEQFPKHFFVSLQACLVDTKARFSLNGFCIVTIHKFKLPPHLKTQLAITCLI